MKKSALVSGSCLLLLLVSCSAPPDFVDINGNGYRYADLKDKWIVVNYWATWCAPCIKEIPELNELAAQNADKLLVLGVNWDGPDPEEALAQAKKMKIAFPVYATEPAERLEIDKPEILPTTFLFSPGLKLVETLKGPQTAAGILSIVEGTTE